MVALVFLFWGLRNGRRDFVKGEMKEAWPSLFEVTYSRS